MHAPATPHPVPDPDPWLERWLPLVAAGAGDGDGGGGGPVLELGCDTGRDTATLVRAGLAVVATDISPRALEACARNVPQAMQVRHNLRQPFPFRDESFGVVLASLCLHYFAWDETLAMAERVRRLLKPGGLLLCRLNSTRDLPPGAPGFRALAPDFYAVDGRYSSTKRYFDEAAVRAMFAEGWALQALEEQTILRYEEPKVAWEAVLRRRLSP